MLCDYSIFVSLYKVNDWVPAEHDGCHDSLISSSVWRCISPISRWSSYSVTRLSTILSKQEQTSKTDSLDVRLSWKQSLEYVLWLILDVLQQCWILWRLIHPQEGH